MYARARMVNELIKTMPLHKMDDDVDVEAKLKFWEDGASSVLELEDDEYYGSDFSRMIVLLAIVDRDYKFHNGIGQANLCPRIVDGKISSDDDIVNDYTPEQVKAKLLAEAEHRPAGMPLGDFIYRRCRVYYEDVIDNVPAELDCRGNDGNVIPFLDALLALE